MIVDLFAGPGGWDEGLRLLGRTDVVGIEWDAAACATAEAAGHHRVQADVAALEPLPFVVGRQVCDLLGIDVVDAIVEGLIASPPCQAWSMAGKRKGELDRANCHRLADRMAAGDDSLDWTTWEDDRSPLVCQPIRWARELRPTWIALEEVPAVASLWEHFAIILRGWGYYVWTGDVLAADYGVPQTRTRRILIAHKERPVRPPAPTHTKNPEGADLFGGELLPWVSMAEALGISPATGFRGERGAGLIERSGHRPVTPATEPAPTITTKARSAKVVTHQQSRQSGGRTKRYARDIDQPAPTIMEGTRLWEVRDGERPPVYVNGNQENAARRSIDEPAPTILFGHQSNDVRWVFERPTTTVVGSFSPDIIAAGSVRVTVEQAGILQSFPPDYPWQGSRTKQFEQVGNAVPPLLAAATLREVL